MKSIVEALQCAEYAIKHPESDQGFAIRAINDTLSLISRASRVNDTCPFCAGLDCTSEQWIAGACQVKCADCGACGPIGDTVKEAQKLWHQRPNLFI